MIQAWIANLGWAAIGRYVGYAIVVLVMAWFGWSEVQDSKRLEALMTQSVELKTALQESSDTIKKIDARQDRLATLFKDEQAARQELDSDMRDSIQFYEEQYEKNQKFRDWFDTVIPDVVK